jgi:cell division protein FtsN
MESRNILLIVICICAFLVLIFGIGFVWSLPERGVTGVEQPRDDENGSGVDIFEHVRDGTELPGLEPTEEPPDKMKIVYGEEEGDTKAVSEEGDKEDKWDESDKKESDAEKDSPVTDKEMEMKTIVIRAPRDEEPEHPTTWIVKPRPTPVPGPTTAPRRLQRVTEYWIQAGSFQSRSKADTLNEKLAEHGFQGQVKTREINGVTYYRVRIGPYQNKKEAEKFLDWLKVLDGMGDSYISAEYTKRWVN